MAERRFHSSLASPLGELLLVSNGTALIRVSLPSEEPDTDVREDGRRDDVLLRSARQQLHAYFAGELRDFELPLAPEGTAFQQRVWQALCAIPYGATISYGELARRVGQPTAARAVGAANGRNPLAIIIPCHRVIGADGALTGYASGLHYKRWLLEHEANRSG